MARKRYTIEQIIRHLREAEVELAKGATTVEVCRKLGISEQTYYRWRKEYGGLRTDQARRLRELERENARLKKLLAESMLDNAILKDDRTLRRAPRGPRASWALVAPFQRKRRMPPHIVAGAQESLTPGTRTLARLILPAEKHLHVGQ